MKNHENGRGHQWDTCLECGKDVTLCADRGLRVHGPRNKHCLGSGRFGQFLQAAIDEARRVRPSDLEAARKAKEAEKPHN